MDQSSKIGKIAQNIKTYVPVLMKSADWWTKRKCQWSDVITPGSVTRVSPCYADTHVLTAHHIASQLFTVHRDL